MVSNAGPSSVADAPVVDTMPASLTGVTWTCTAGVGGHCDNSGPVAGDINTTVDLGVNGSVQFTVTGTIAGPTVGSVVNTATVSAPAGVTETNSADNAATDATAVTTTAALSISKTDGQTTDVAGTSSTYTIVVTNSGPSAVVGAAVTDALPPGFTNASWTCVAAGAGSCADAGPTTGNVNTTVDLPSGTSATFTVTGTIDASFTGVLSNTATVIAPPGTIDDPANNTATDTTTVVAEANLVVTKSDGTTTATPGTATTYTVTVGNTGPSAVTGATVSDALPVGATSMNWTCSATAGSSCTASGSGAIADIVGLLPGGQLTYVVTVDIAAAATGSLTNVATATVPATVTETTPLDNSATDTDTLVASTDLAITKTDGALDSRTGHRRHLHDRGHQQRSVRCDRGHGDRCVPRSAHRRQLDLHRPVHARRQRPARRCGRSARRSHRHLRRLGDRRPVRDRHAVEHRDRRRCGRARPTRSRPTIRQPTPTR